jgi:hypothetical protein
MVMMNTGPRRWDPVGIDNTICVPFLVSGTTPSRSERYFVTGNERTPFTFYQGGIEKAAYHVDAADKFGFILELMNMNMEDQIVYITQTYDILDGPLPTGWKEVKTVFLDVKSCLTSEYSPPVGKTSFLIESKPWTPNIEGKILDAGGHLHDGGVYVDLTSNATNTLCRSTARYSEKPDYIWRGAAMDGEKIARDHISSMGGCETKDLAGKEMQRDQSWVIKAQYDYNQKAGNEEGGKMAEVMGIAIVLVAVPPGSYSFFPWIPYQKLICSQVFLSQYDKCTVRIKYSYTTSTFSCVRSIQQLHKAKCTAQPLRRDPITISGQSKSIMDMLDLLGNHFY